MTAPRRAAPKRSAPPVVRPRYGTAPPIGSEADLDAALQAIERLDPPLVAHLMAIGGRPPLRRHAAGFEGLAAIVVGQQVSTASARAILGRLAAAVSPLDAGSLAATSDATLRACGLSTQKIRTLRAASEAVLAGTLPFDDLALRPAEDAVALLTAIKGIGPWTADIFLLTCLGHADAWPAGDLALQEAARIALELDRRPSAAALAEIGERWRPLRAIAARLLWSYYRAVKGNREGMVLNDDRVASASPRSSE